MIERIRLKSKESIKEYLLNMSAFFMILVYWELLLYYLLHTTFKGFSFWNVTFLIPIAFVLSSFVGCFKEKQLVNDIIRIVILFVVSLFYLIDLIYYRTFGSLVSASMLGSGTDAVTNFWWSVSTTIKENFILIILFELPIILMVYRALNRKNRKGILPAA